jgi:opacity protein-like surface antigen
MLEVDKMKRELASGALVVGLTLLAAAAQAQPTGDWYVAGAVTGSFLIDPKSKIDNAPTPGAELFITNNVNSGWGGQLALGHAFGPWRLEAEVGLTDNHTQSYTVTSPISVTIPERGGDRITRYMVNAYFDVPVHTLPVRPFLGAGVGAADVHVTAIASRPFGPPMPPTTLIDDSTSGFAWQLMAGAALPVTRRLSLTLQYRWFDADTMRGHDTRGQRFTTQIAGHNLDLGLRWMF